MLYCIDASALLKAHQSHPLAEDVDFWEKISDAITQGLIISSEVVSEELKYYEPELYTWASKQRHFIVPLDEETLAQTKIIINRFPQLIDPLASGEQASPYIVALAQILSATIVTEESDDNPNSKLMHACLKLRIRTISLAEMIKQLKSSKNW